MDWNATFFFLISPHFLLRCLTWQCYLLSERIPPPPLIYRLIPRADAWLAKGENTTHGRFVLRHTEFPSHRDGWQARDNAFVTPLFFSICSTYNGKHSGCVSTLHAKRRQWSSILQAERRETAAALQKHVCRWRLCVQIGCPVISTSEKTWARTHNQRGKEEIPPRMSQLCLYRHVLWKWRMLWSYSRRKYTVYTTTAITSIQMLKSVHQFVFYFGWDKNILTTIWSTAVKFSPNIRQGTTRSGPGDPSTFLHAPPWDCLHSTTT